MSYRYTLEAALESLQDIEELMRGFLENGEVPSIELDLSLQKLRNIYELLLVLKRPADLPMNGSPGRDSVSGAVSEANTVAVAAAAAEVKEVAVAVAEAEVKEVAAVVSASEAKAVAAATPAAEAEADVAAPNSPRTSAPVSVPPSVQGKETVAENHGAQTLSDLFKSRATLHETLHQSLGNEGQLHSQGRPVENLMSAIAINDRFTFIRELFNGDSHAFEFAIKTFNEAASFNDAYNFMTQNYEWDMDSEAVQMLLDIIRRKFILSRHE